jgi:hypothetical protein
MRAALFGVIVLAVACTEARTPKVPARQAMPACPKGTFAAELDALLPALEPVRPVSLLPVHELNRAVEPGCVVPFRKEPDDRMLDVGRVVARASSRTSKGKPINLGRGRLEVGRRALRLRLTNVAGDESLTLIIEGAHVSFTQKGEKPFEGDISSDDPSPLPYPFDALVAALDKCDDDQRLGRTEDGNVIEARRGDFALWRSRWLDTTSNAIVDTSYSCTKNDARLMWRTAIGDCLPMIAAASARSDRTLVIVRQGESDTEDIMDYGFDGAR